MIAALTRLARHLAQKAWEALAILDLFRRAAREKGKGFLWAGAYGAARWSVSRRSADRLIFWLEELGHLEVIDRGDRHTPRTIKMHLIPLEDVDQAEIRKNRLEVARRWDPVMACAHSTYSAAPALISDCPFALTDDPDPCRSGSVTVDPFPVLGISLGSCLPASRTFAAEESHASTSDQTATAARPHRHPHLRLISSPNPPATATASARVAEVIR